MSPDLRSRKTQAGTRFRHIHPRIRVLYDERCTAEIGGPLRGES